MKKALSQIRCSGPKSIWPPFEYSDVFYFTSTLSMHMHAELKRDQGLNYNVKKVQLIVQLIYVFSSDKFTK